MIGFIYLFCCNRIISQLNKNRKKCTKDICLTFFDQRKHIDPDVHDFIIFKEELKLIRST